MNTPAPGPTPLLWCWRHPKARGAAGRCIGQTDLPVDLRKAKRLAHRIRRCAREQRLPHEVWVSPLARSREVGRWLSRWGWNVRLDARLLEVGFGRWDGQRWGDIPAVEVGAWADELLTYRPGGGESVAMLLLRVHAFAAEAQAAGAGTSMPRLLVGHAGWMNALLHVPPDSVTLPASNWPPAPPHGALRRWGVGRGA